MSSPSNVGTLEPVPSPAPATPEATPPAVDAAAPAAAAPAAPVAAGPAPEPLPAGATPVLVVQRGMRPGVEYPIYEGKNFMGRTDEEPVDINLEDQEPAERTWSSRQHSCITFENGLLIVEDLNSANGTYVNRTRVWPGTKQPVKVGDVIQIGTIHMKVKA